MLLEIDGLTVRYGKAKALDGVSLQVGEGEIVSIVGANGAGKTTLLRTISGLKKPASGEIRFCGRRIDRMRPHQIVRLGIAQIPAGRMLFAPMTVLDNLKTGAHLRHDREQIKQDLHMVYRFFPILEEKKNQLAGQLSGGQQQMLAMGRALMARPKMLLLDEPCNGLSPIVVAEIGTIIEELNKEGHSIVLVEQNCRVALKLASRAYILELGAVALQGAGEALAGDKRVRKCYLGGI
ncbi:MAG: ABC transporter ATP-binding protein [Thermoleophilia bacterium]|nr:ABC transporter ATP-binding protein [Thermoleophilia bacterium]